MLEHVGHLTFGEIHMSYSLNSSIPLNNPYSALISNPLYNLRLGSLDSSSHEDCIQVWGFASTWRLLN